MILAADIGATKTIIAAYTGASGPRRPVLEKTYATADCGGIAAMLRAFGNELGHAVSRAVLGIAGPVNAGTARMTNLPWVLDEEGLGGEMGYPVTLINDLEAIAAAVPCLAGGDLAVLNQGSPVPGGSIAVIAPGTGLGEAFLAWDGKRYRPQASEGGHADFGPRNFLEAELFGFMHALFGHVSYERLCSGPGIYNIYSFLKDRGYGKEPAWFGEELARAGDPTPVIVANAMDPARRCDICRDALRLFVSILGAEAGNLALKVKSTGGIYVAGGIPLRILPYLEEPGFLESLRDKGRQAFLICAMPVSVVTNPRVGLLGAAVSALEDADA
jgi:glucokinase